MNALSSLPKLGVGINYQPEFIPLLRGCEDVIDFIEVSPDILCQEYWDGAQRRTGLSPDRLSAAIEWCRLYPVVVHGLGLSIGSASGWNQDYIRILDDFADVQPFHWHSEHLGFLQIRTADGADLHAGVQLPVPFTEEALNIICPRIEAIQQRYQVPFLLENTTYYLPNMPHDAGMDEIEFLNRITERTSCGLLLDLYNLYCNAINFGFDVYEALSRLDMSRVVEIHVAGGAIHEGLQLDVHSDKTPQPVWELLDWTLQRAPNAHAITYELLEQALDIVSERGVQQQLQTAREIWLRHRQPVKEERRYAVT
ncbi:DUF692 family protein [Hahella sp. KA22]|uniref:DUF692 domain-containing protein n=1 Tax=Hahella sp. KA22 TaxID=1628392 RepID=UPI000FDF62D6|nr:DUF692 family multinuclear iron-containing protein [Hahella sp. KA22]AZZ89729.1 DUF692 family protein [Hahella sp. KA22]QAY53099.1 DUF692 family protein [Hahella sp. KA22]